MVRAPLQPFALQPGSVAPASIGRGEHEEVCRELYVYSRSRPAAASRESEEGDELWRGCLRRLCELEESPSSTAAVCEARRLDAWEAFASLRASRGTHLGNVSSSSPLQVEVGATHASVSWSAGVVLALFLVAMAHLLRVLGAERLRYRQRRFGSDVLFLEFLKYRFSLWFAWAPGSAMIMLCLVTMNLIIAGGALHSIFTGVDLSSSLWLSWIWVAAGDAGSSSAPGGTHVAMVVAIGGMLIFATLVSLVTTAFEAQLERLRQGALPVVESGHTVILGWKPMACDIISELCLAAASRGGGAIVVLAQVPKPEVEAAIQARQIDFRNSVVSVRSGSAHIQQDLDHVALKSAKNILVLSEPGISEEDADARTSRVLLMLSTLDLGGDTNLVVDCCLVRNRELFYSLMETSVQVVCVQDFIGELLVESSRQHGSAAVIHEVLGFEGDEFYVSKLSGLVGWSFNELLFAFPSVVPIGFAKGSEIVLVPDMNYTFEGGEDVFLLAEDVAEVPDRLPEWGSEAGKGIRDTRLQAHELRYRCEAHAVASPSSRSPQGRPEPAKEFILVFGWNRSAGSSLIQLDSETALGSEVWIYSPVAVAEREQFLRSAQERRQYHHTNIIVKNVHGMLGARYALEQLPIEKAKRIFFLADNHGAKSPSETDGSTIAVILQVRDVLRKRERVVADQAIVPQILLASTEGAIRSTGLSDVVNSTELSARVLAGLCVTPLTGGVVSSFFSQSGARFSIRKLSDLRSDLHHRMGGELLEISFHEVMALAEDMDEVAIGWSKVGGAGGGMEWDMNPKDKSARRAWSGYYRIVTISPPKTGPGMIAKSPSLMSNSRFSRSSSPTDLASKHAARSEQPARRPSATAFAREVSDSESSQEEDGHAVCSDTGAPAACGFEG